MTFVSYAQNFEDVMLWRALKHVQNGVYVDVGAQHPVIDSVSKAFYEHGWRGIHIEPVPAYAELLRKDRPDETVLQVALADAEGILELNVIPDSGLSTAIDTYAQRHQVERGYVLQQIQVPVLTLKAATKSLMGKDVHWLKIDVEGFEEKVLKGWDSQTLRPWVMVVEATIPNSPEEDYVSWDPILTAADYQFVYFDGLNRFYVAKEHIELAEAFSCPPNVFDNVRLSGHASSELCRGLITSQQEKEKELAAQAEWQQNEYNLLQTHTQWLQNEYNQLQTHAQWLQNEWNTARQRIEELSKSTGRLETELNAAEAQAQQAEARAAPAEAQAQQLHGRLIAVHQSTSWYITKPLRAVKRLLGGDFLPIRQVIQAAELLAKKTLRPLLGMGVNTGAVPPPAQNLVTPPQPNQRQEATFPEGVPNLTPRARRIYLHLKAAIDHRNKENG